MRFVSISIAVALAACSGSSSRQSQPAASKTTASTSDTAASKTAASTSDTAPSKVRVVLASAVTVRDMTGDGLPGSLIVEALPLRRDTVEVVLRFVTQGRQLDVARWHWPGPVDQGEFAQFLDSTQFEPASKEFEGDSVPTTRVQQRAYRSPLDYIGWELRRHEVAVTRLAAGRDTQPPDGPEGYQFLREVDASNADPAEVLAIGKEILEHAPVAFTYVSSEEDGGTRAVIAWSQRAGRFFKLWECC